MKVNNYYVELDCLLDTRLGSIACYNLALSARLALNESYHTRFHNELHRIDDNLGKDEYQALWDNRKEMDTLVNSRVTKFMYQLRGLIDATRVSEAFIPYKQTGNVFIDIHGWGLSEEELDELKQCLIGFLVTDKITLVDIGYENLTPGLIRDNYNSVSIVDFNKWVNIHIEALGKCRIPSVGFHCPAVLQNPDDEAMVKLYESGLTQDGTREGFATALRLTWYSPGDFSIINLVED